MSKAAFAFPKVPNWVPDRISFLIRGIYLRHFETDAILVAYGMLEGASPALKSKKNIQEARILIARELLRRNIIFWENI